jgi:hypothetical protein
MSQVARQARSEGGGSSAAELTDIGPGSTVTGLDEQELAVLRQVGGHGRRALGGRPASVRALPIDPGLHRFPRSVAPRLRGRFAPVDFVATGDPAEVVATAHAGAGTSRSARAASTCRRVLLGAPLNGSAVDHERMRKPVALAILSSDALSSVAYGPEAMLAVLAWAGGGAGPLARDLVGDRRVDDRRGLSYRQLIRAYPHGGGSYIVAARDLGELPALIVAGALMTEYVLTVAGPATATPRACSYGPATAWPVSNGTIALALAAAVLFVLFAGRTEALIPLYAVGVFVALTFSQVGMVVHWWRRRDEHWRRSMPSGARRAAGVLHRRAAHPATRPHADRRPA